MFFEKQVKRYGPLQAVREKGAPVQGGVPRDFPKSGVSWEVQLEGRNCV